MSFAGFSFETATSRTYKTHQDMFIMISLRAGAMYTLRPFATAARRSLTEPSWETRAWALEGSIFISSCDSLISLD